MRREQDTVDRRATWGVLTPAGLDAVEKAAPGHVTEVRKIVPDPLTAAQRRALGAASERILRTIAPYIADPAEILDRCATPAPDPAHPPDDPVTGAARAR